MQLLMSNDAGDEHFVSIFRDFQLLWKVKIFSIIGFRSASRFDFTVVS